MVYYNYPTSGVGAALGRLGDIADDDSGESGRTKYVDYMYLGAGTVETPRPPAEPPAGPSGQRKIKFPISKRR